MVAAYLYWPTIYLAVYLPFIVPRLPTWDHVPGGVIAAILASYLALLLAAGRGRDHRRIAVHALGIAVSVDAFSLLVAWLRTPGFGKTLASGFDPWEALVTVLHALVVLVALEAGRVLGRLASARRSPA
jgi:hypothetical protein